MEAFLVSSLAVTLGEIGDKTQLLALLLAARFKKPVAVIMGILCATLANHTTAGALGEWVAENIPQNAMRWFVGVSFIAIGLWALKPDKLDEKENDKLSSYGAFVTTLVAFFIAEIGDKTQVATMMLAVKYHDLVPVVSGTTLGMMIVDVPTVLLGGVMAKKIPLQTFRYMAAGLFIIIGVLALVV